MKLNKMDFANVVAHCVSNGMSIGEYEINRLDELISFETIVPERVYPSANDIDMLMFYMDEGKRRVEAIKLYRTLTGCGLKESKDAVEKYWVSKVES